MNNEFYYLLLVIAIIFSIIYIYIKTKLNSIKGIDSKRHKLINSLTKNAIVIKMTIDNCEVIQNNYYHDNFDSEGYKIQTSKLLDEFYDSSKNITKQAIEQSSIIYFHNEKRMISQVFPTNAFTLANKINKEKIILLIDHSNIENYKFELIS